MMQPFQGWLRSPCRPRVAAARQPWADIRSPFRAQRKALPNPPGTLKPEEPFFYFPLGFTNESNFKRVVLIQDHVLLV
uniref:Uncharacterized protein n=1 Tax=Candidatus Kentrum sp. TUN TaxID=2126343 RepID=A0A450ZW56_9GAMM|nr:MAG: hypothetical protein BECKTUN1418F_GA0071002_11332 [Candidatus Kentron sp. TUN]VFK67052.1 MAG: hypothetical protein BECKTUN1418E_GA0071001_11302 [Candidatus Kentron sp. TUN]